MYRSLAVFFACWLTFSARAMPGNDTVDHFRADGSKEHLDLPQDMAAWAKRRAEFWQVIKGVRQNDPKSIARLDAILTEVEQQPFGRTPIEILDVNAAFYVPREGVKKCFPVIVAAVALAWYDALRFTDESGRAEIANNERLFTRAFDLAGPEAKAQAIQFLESEPAEAAKSLEQGLGFAEKLKDTATYDRQWPTAYGLANIQRSLGGTEVKLKLPPESEWPDLWQQTKKRVHQYYSLK